MTDPARESISNRLVTLAEFVAAIAFAFIAGIIFALYYFQPMNQEVDIDAGMKLECSQCVWYSVGGGPYPGGEKP